MQFETIIPRHSPSKSYCCLIVGYYFTRPNNSILLQNQGPQTERAIISAVHDRSIEVILVRFGYQQRIGIDVRKTMCRVVFLLEQLFYLQLSPHERGADKRKNKNVCTCKSRTIETCLTLKLSFHALEIPYDSQTTLSQNLIGCSTLSQKNCKLIGLIFDITVPYTMSLL